MKVYVLLFCLCCAVPAVAQLTVAQSSEYLESRGLSSVAAERTGSRNMLRGTDKAGRSVRIEYDQIPNQDALDLVLAMHDRLASWKSVETPSFLFVLESDQVRLHVLPSRFTGENIDFLQYAPGGLNFTGTVGTMDYDFRLKVENLFIRFQGIVTSERLILERLVQAVENPVQFIRDNDPSYSAFRIAELQEELDRVALAAAAVYAKGLFGSPRPIPAAVRDEVVRLRRADPDISVSAIRASLREGGLDATEKQIQGLLFVYFSE